MASRSLGTLTLDIIAKIGGLTSGLSQAERQAKRSADNLSRTFKGVQRTVTGVFAAIGAGALIRSIVRATSEAEEAFALLENAVERNGGAAGRTTKQLADMATQLQSVTTYSDEAVQGAEQLLLRFRSIQGTNFDDALKATLDLATALKIDLDTAAKLVGKTLEKGASGLGALAKAGVVVSESQKKVIKSLYDTGRVAEGQAVILGELKASFDGAAEAARNTFPGALKGLKNAFGDLLEGKGLTGAVEGINDLTDTLNSPEVKEGFAVLIGGLTTLIGLAAKAASVVPGFAKFLGESLAAAINGPAADDVVRLDDQIVKLQKHIKQVEGGVGFGKLIFGLNEKQKKDIEESRKKIVQLQALIDSAQNTKPKSGATPVTGIQSPSVIIPSEEFLKLEAKLKEQIALYGKVGEAAKIAYQIQAGELDELSAAEQQRVLSLARQYDSQVKAAETAKELADQAKELAQEQKQQQEQLTQAFESQEASLLRQLALTADATEVEQLRYEVTSGGLRKITADQKDWLIELAKEADLMKHRIDLETEVKKVVEDTLTPLEKYQKTIQTLNELFEESGAVLGKQGLSYEAYKKAVEQAQDELEKATKKSNDFLIAAANGTQGVLADTLFGAMEGKIDNIEDAFVKMINNLVAQALAAKLTEKLFGAPDKQGNPSGGGWLDSLGSIFGSLFGGGKASGGSANAGTLFRVNEYGTEALAIPGRSDYLMMGRQGGQVVPASRSSGGGGNVKQVINVNGVPNQRTARQMQIQAAQQQRMATARLA